MPSSSIKFTGSSFAIPNPKYGENDPSLIHGVVSAFDIRNPLCWTPGAPSAVKAMLNNLARPPETTQATATILAPTAVAQTSSGQLGLILPGHTAAGGVFGAIDTGNAINLTGPHIRIIWAALLQAPQNSGAAFWARAGSSNPGQNSAFNFSLNASTPSVTIFTVPTAGGAESNIPRTFLGPITFGTVYQWAYSVEIEGSGLRYKTYQNGALATSSLIPGTTSVYPSTRNTAIGGYSPGTFGASYAVNMNYYRSTEEDLTVSGTLDVQKRVQDDWNKYRASFGL
ncbi:hypothetical protein [Deinococcus sp. UYEF24]